MKYKISSHRAHTHHAYYIEGRMSQFLAYKERLNPFWAKEFERFGIDEARALIQLCSLKNFGETMFFIATASITHEAQQALLKLFEEPQQGTTFVLLIPHGALIGTLRSRMLPYPHSVEEATRGNVKKFLQSPYAARSLEIAAMLKDEEGIRERAREFVNGLEGELCKY